MPLTSQHRSHVVALVLLGASACAAFEPTFRPRAGRSGPTTGPTPDLTRPAGIGPAGIGSDTAMLARPRTANGRGRATAGDLTERRVCRTSTWPRGWIAVAYEPSTSECPTRAGSDSTGAVAILVQYTARAVGTRLDVCRDQPIPSDWNVDDEGPANADACPGAAPEGQSTVRRIRRTF